MMCKGMLIFKLPLNSDGCHPLWSQYDAEYFSRPASRPETLLDGTLKVSVFNRFGAQSKLSSLQYEENVPDTITYSELTQHEYEALIPVFEVWERALDNWEIDNG